MQQKLWTKNFTLIILATALGSAGAIAGGFALSFLVFDETGSTLAAALVFAVRTLPYVLVPLVAAPIMDRLPRKTFLVAGDIVNGVAYALLGLWLFRGNFSYVGYLVVSVLLSCLQSVDSLAYNSLYPDLIPGGAEEKGYAVFSMLYPILNIVMTPLAALLLDRLGVPLILLLQGSLSIAAALIESGIHTEAAAPAQSAYTFSQWLGDIKEGFDYLKNEKGLRSIYAYMAVTNGMAQGYAPLMVAFFRTAAGFSPAMYSLFSAAEFIGRSAGSALQYRIKLPKEKRHGFVFFVYQFYELMDMVLLWLPYPLMLVNRAFCGFLGSNSAIVRSAAVQRYIPANLRSRINAYNDTLITAAGGLLSLAVGALGEWLDIRLCLTVCGAVSMLASWYFIAGRSAAVRAVYEHE
ncbi:MAG: MFS transporter [Oscillospiraceae bacterium]|nr:MFS transporter [Oscillospiraceae bacterium]